jgi:hypothetical protein
MLLGNIKVTKYIKLCWYMVVISDQDVMFLTEMSLLGDKFGYFFKQNMNNEMYKLLTE